MQEVALDVTPEPVSVVGMEQLYVSFDARM
jgi:hypothetical protein